MRSRPFMIALALAGALITLPAIAAPPYYARGAYYAGTAGTWGADAGNQLFDDGTHGDGAANDGIYGVYVTSDQPTGAYGFKVANADWTENWPNHPDYPLSNAIVWIEEVGQVLHFVLDTNDGPTGWQPVRNAVATDSYAPSGTLFELIGSAPELGNWDTGIGAIQDGSLLHATATIATPGDYEFKFRAIGTWTLCNFGVHYNMLIGDNFKFTTTDSNTEMTFEMDVATGRGRGVPTSLTPTLRSTWGRLRSLYR